MKVAVAQIDTASGDVDGNLRKVRDAVGQAAERGADLVAFPEFALVGWGVADLARERAFQDRHRAAVREVAALSALVPIVLGGIAAAGRGRPRSVPMAFCEGERVRPEGGVVTIKGRRIALWAGRSSLVRSGRGAADVGIWLCAWPYRMGEHAERELLWSRAAVSLRAPVAVVNLVGGNGGFVFDGRSAVFDAQGRKVAEARPFAEDLLVLDLTALPRAYAAAEMSAEEELLSALVLGVRDFVHKCGFAEAVLGLSGGVDSAVVAAIAARALGPERVVALGMPTVYSSQLTQQCALAVAQNLGIRYHVLPIEELRGAFGRALQPLFRGTEEGTAEENIQARIRAVLLMAYANKFNACLLATGNRSEVATGYCTLYGDTAGALAVIADVPKMQVYALARHINRAAEVIPRQAIEMAPTAELKPGQTDQDVLPPYPVLDEILRLLLDERLDPADIIARGFDPSVVDDVVARVKRADFKRRQLPPALRVFSRPDVWPEYPIGVSLPHWPKSKPSQEAL